MVYCKWDNYYVFVRSPGNGTTTLWFCIKGTTIMCFLGALVMGQFGFSESPWYKRKHFGLEGTPDNGTTKIYLSVSSE